VIAGAFIEGSDDRHVGLRDRMLAADAHLPRLPSSNADKPAMDVLGDIGFLVLENEQPLGNDELVAFGTELGIAQPETHPSVRPYVEEEVILNLLSEYSSTRDVDLQPFATNALTLHTESSTRPAARQPRFIVLMCCDPGDDSTWAQTVVVPMDRVAARITSREREILARTRYRDNRDGPTILRYVSGRPVFSFRDFGDQRLCWTYDGDDAVEDDANDAIRSLLEAMYAPDISLAVEWRRGTLVVIDNTFVFHGRTAGTGAQPKQRRHLKRLRIQAPAHGVDRTS
jgi:hypothetical protein